MLFKLIFHDMILFDMTIYDIYDSNDIWCFGVVILPTLIEMPDQLNQHTTSCVLPASLQV